MNSQPGKDASGTQRNNDQTNNKTNEKIVSKPTFAAMVQTKLPSINTNEPLVEIQYGTHLGKPAVFFRAEDYFINLAKQCRLAIIGKFCRGKPSMEEIHKTFVSKFHLSGTVKIAYFDLDNEANYSHVFTKE